MVLTKMIELIGIIALLIVSLFFLLKGADSLVDGAVDVAKWLKVSPMLIGLTIVAFGTSLPELMVSLFSALGGNYDLSVGNIIGSNIFNIAVIIGVSAVIVPLTISKTTLAYEFPFMIISALLLLLLANDTYIFQENTFTLGRFDGIIFLGAFALFMYYIILSAQNDRKANHAKKEIKAANPHWKNTLLVIGGLAALIAGGKAFTYSASRLAELMGLSQAFIGLTVAAIGTSLPELATSAMAAWKKQKDLAVGNIIGSNIFNILFVLGVTSLIHPIVVSPAMIATDGMVMILVSFLFLYFAARYRNISRWEGIALLTTYAIYFGYLIWRL